MLALVFLKIEGKSVVEHHTSLDARGEATEGFIGRVNSFFFPLPLKAILFHIL
jgi:hypothetical protein